MELIRLSMDLGLIVIEKLKEIDQEYEPRKTSTGIFSFEFSEEELFKITELEIDNPKPGMLKGLEYFKNLQKLKIDYKNYSAYKKDNMSITDDDIKVISKLKSLKSLSIIRQEKITWIDLTDLKNLEELEIISNNKIDTIVGLNQLDKLKELSIYGNKELYEIDGLEEVLEKINFDSLELDLMHLSEISKYFSKLLNTVSCTFVETTSNRQNLRYNVGSAMLFHKKCLKIVDDIVKHARNKKELIILVEKYIAQNIFYDYDGLNNKDRLHYENGVRKGLKKGTQSAYNGIMFGSCVCEGYTRSMQYLLKLLEIKTKNVYCISGKDKIKFKTDYHNLIELPDDGYHSILRIDLNDGIYYCDPCWDSTHWHKGDKTLPYCLKSKSEILKDHTLSFEEDDVSIDSGISKVSNEEIQIAIDREELGRAK